MNHTISIGKARPGRRAFRLGFSIVTALSAGHALAQTVIAPTPFSFDTAYGRLPKNVVPLDYTIALVPDIATKTLRGKESVTLNFREATATIQFNSLNMKLDHVLFDGKPVAAVESSDERQLTSITLAAPARVGKHTLSFSYDGKIESGPQGMFVQTYAKPGGGKDTLISTKFEATDARRMFPCWDEPAFRATFELTATVPAAWATISNMPVAKRKVDGALATTTFARSPKMPTYLVEFTAGDMARISTKVGATELGIWAVRGQEQDGKTALANATQILADYNDYFGYSFPLPKLDSIGIPGGFSGAMENWGAITYNDQILLLSDTATMGQRQAVFSVQAHEMAHQWNGDLVTMGWWDDLWLNESFASWRAAKETDARHPDWNWWENQDASKEGAMGADARVSSQAVGQHVNTELEARSAFDHLITYSKGQAVLRMLEAYLGADTFRSGIRAYMQAHAFSNSTGADLWLALSKASGQDIGALAGNWIQQPGYPLVTVDASCDAQGQRSLRFTQKRFLLQGADANNARWSIPLQIRSGAGAPQSLLLTQDGQSTAAGHCGEALSVNAATVGFYRVQYDAATLKTNTDKFASLPRADRIALLDDQWALTEADGQNLASYLQLAAAMATQTDERAWEQILGALSSIERFERGTPGHAAFTAYARSIVKPLAENLGWDAKGDETPGKQRLRRTALGELGAWGDQDVIAEARKRFAAFQTDRSKIRSDDQNMILTIVARDADAATFEQLHAIAKSAKNETELRRYYPALMTVRDPKLAEAAAAIALSDEISQQAAGQRLGLILTLEDEHPELSWNRFTGNLETLMAPSPQYRSMIIAESTPAYFWNTVPLAQLDAWTREHVPAGMAPNVNRGMESARLKLREKAMLIEAADRFVAANGQHNGQH
jgi:aminopeptidase N